MIIEGTEDEISIAITMEKTDVATTGFKRLDLIQEPPSHIGATSHGNENRGWSVWGVQETRPQTLVMQVVG